MLFFKRVTLRSASLLAAFFHPGHVLCVCSQGFIHLPPRCSLEWLCVSFFYGGLRHPALDAVDDMRCHPHGTDDNALAAGR
ncbi:hypothetical protein CSP26_16215 [Salmonella enterica subsp. indica]|nr:hypothetical protein [Salmonella enterica subsp. indica]